MKRVRHINGGKILELSNREAEEMVKSKQFYVRLKKPLVPAGKIGVHEQEGER